MNFGPPPLVVRGAAAHPDLGAVAGGCQVAVAVCVYDPHDDHLGEGQAAVAAHLSDHRGDAVKMRVPVEEIDHGVAAFIEIAIVIAARQGHEDAPLLAENFGMYFFGLSDFDGIIGRRLRGSAVRRGLAVGEGINEEGGCQEEVFHILKVLAVMLRPDIRQNIQM
ncbi:hypothetical protein ACQ86N_01570 [Puia sp. P3]|uniref:hypothetical protein n=1 Tax=Puia sp. P3 TaxID=3423952 RepID=UPI003D66AAEF